MCEKRSSAYGYRYFCRYFCRYLAARAVARKQVILAVRFANTSHDFMNSQKDVKNEYCTTTRLQDFPASSCDWMSFHGLRDHPGSPHVIARASQRV
jgi:hypothetical protein